MFIHTPNPGAAKFLRPTSAESTIGRVNRLEPRAHLPGVLRENNLAFLSWIWSWIQSFRNLTHQNDSQLCVFGILANRHSSKWRLPSKWAPPNLDMHWHSQPWGEVNSVRHKTHIHQRMTACTCPSFISDSIYSTLLPYYISASIFKNMSLSPRLAYFISLTWLPLLYLKGSSEDGHTPGLFLQLRTSLCSEGHHN